MIPDPRSRESLGFFLAENLLVSPIFLWQFGFFFFFLLCELGGFGLLRSCWEGYICHMYDMVWGLTGNVSLSGDETSSVRVLSTEDDGELFGGYPTPGPINVWLYCSEPGVPQDDISISYVRQEESKTDFGDAMVHI